MRAILQAMNHPQPPAPMKTNNTTATGFVYNHIQFKRSRLWDMQVIK